MYWDYELAMIKRGVEGARFSLTPPSPRPLPLGEEN